MSGETNWKSRPEGGGRFALWLISTIARRCGRAPTRLLLYPITAYFLIVRGPERRASHDYLTRVLGRPPGLWKVACHVHLFATTILDRLFLLGGRLDLFDIEPIGVESLQQALAPGRGVLIFGSHLGSFDALRALKRLRGELKLRVVLDRAHNRVLTDIFDRLDPALAAGIIDAGMDGASVALAIKQAADEGAMVAMLVDRAQPGEPSLRVPFLGELAPLPTTPWLIASALKIPVVLAFGIYRDGNHYQLGFQTFREQIDIPRAQRSQALEAVMNEYAAHLQQRVLDAPYNWFNFYDFWQKGADANTGDDAPVVRRRVAGPRG